jgi:hypothetical protein
MPPGCFRMCCGVDDFSGGLARTRNRDLLSEPFASVKLLAHRAATDPSARVVNHVLRLDSFPVKAPPTARWHGWVFCFSPARPVRLRLLRAASDRARAGWPDGWRYSSRRPFRLEISSLRSAFHVYHSSCGGMGMRDGRAGGGLCRVGGCRGGDARGGAGTRLTCGRCCMTRFFR